MKKIAIYVMTLLLVVIITVSGTYAYFVATTSSEKNAVSSDSSKLEVIYTGDKDISGTLNLVNSKEEGYRLTTKIALAEDSVDAFANMFIKVNEMGNNLATDAFNWEAHKTFNGTTNIIATGTFKGAKAGDKIYFDKNYRLPLEETQYTIYIWLDGNKIGNEAIGQSFEIYIGAEAQHITELK